MKKKYLFLAIFVIFVSFSVPTYANTFIEKKIDGITIRAVEYEIGSPDYDIKIVASQEATTLTNLLIKNNAITGVNGVFFCPSDYSECGGKTYTINERYVEGKKIATYDDTGARVVFGWDEDKIPFLFQTNKINADKEEDIYEGFANHPLLLQDGENKLEWYYDQGLIDKKMVAKSPRNFICSDKDKEHIYFGYVYTPTMDELISALLEFGCWDALNLDAGKSASYVYNGRILAKGERQILDAVVVERRDIDVAALEKIVEKAFVYVHDKVIANKTQKKKLDTLKSLSTQVDNARQALYDKYSSDVYDSDTGLKIGYQIKIESKSLIKKIYFINRLQYLLKQEMENYAL